MSLTPTDGPTVRDSGGQTDSSSHSRPSLSGRERLKAFAVSLQRGVDHGRRSLATAARSGLNRLFSPGLIPTEGESLADDAVDPPPCPAIGQLPARAFPVTYPTRAYHLVENDVDLVAERREETVTISHPDVSESWIQSDTWTRVQR